MTYYKVLAGLQSCNGGSWEWTPGVRTPTRKVKICESGWHFATKYQLADWINQHLTVYEVTPTKNRKVTHDVGKCVCSSVTLGKKIGTINAKVVWELNRKSLVFAVRQNIKDQHTLSEKEKKIFSDIADLLAGPGRMRDKIRFVLKARNSAPRNQNLRYNLDTLYSNMLQMFKQKFLRIGKYYSNPACTAYNGNLIIKTLREKGNV